MSPKKEMTLEIECRWNDNPYRDCVLDGVRFLAMTSENKIHDMWEFDLPKTDKNWSYMIRLIKKTFPAERLLKRRITKIIEQA